ncbi:MAG TPA: M1 family aminopeptidase [Candidatus Polarisedimenticolaceae bacterium]|nr:M1 family aminopeptidase [Candidatus Polarisedimenticolaceae bacterium]
MRPVTCILLALLATAPLRAAEASPQLRAALELPLRELARDLAQERSPEGWSRRRLAYSRAFRPLPDGRWETVAYRDTAEGDRMRTERLVLTLAPSGRKAWQVQGERVEDVYDTLYRSVPGGETFARFDAFTFEEEGIRLRAEGGSVATTRFAGDVTTLTIVADAMRFTYDPPPEEREIARVAEVLATDRAERRTFAPERFTLTCSPGECAYFLGTAFQGLRPAPEADVHRALRRAMADRRERLTDFLQENGFRGFRRPVREENRFWTVAVKRDTVLDYAVWLAFDDEQGNEVTYGTSEDGPLYSYHSAATRLDVSDPAALERRDDADARDFEVRSIRGTVDLALGTPDTLSADLVYVLRLKRPLRALPFFIARLRNRGGENKENREPSLTLDVLQDGEGHDLTFARTGPAGGYVVLPQELPAGTEVTLHLAFENRGAIYKLTPSYSRVARGGWLPFVRASDRIDHWDLTVRVPAAYTALGVGRPVEKRREGHVAVTRWTTDASVTFPTVIFGRYVKAEPAIHARRSDGTEIPVTIYADEVGMRDWDIRPRQLPALADQAVNALNLYREIFGVDYPFPKLDLVNDPLGFLYGQSPASIVYLGSGAFRGSGTLGNWIGAGATRFTRALVAHEVAHQWWGGLITNANERSYWWVESLAEYSAALYEEAVAGRESPERGRRAYLDHVEGWRREILEAGLFGSVEKGSIVNVGGYRAALYAKGPYAFHMLRVTHGDDAFFRFLKALAREMQGKEIVTRDIQRVAEREIGVDLEVFFDQWIRGAGIPELALDWRTRKNEDGTWFVEGSIRQRVVLGEKRLPMDGVYYLGMVAVASLGAKTKSPVVQRLSLQGAETTFAFKVDEEPGDVVLNAGEEMLAYAGPVTWSTADGRRGVLP